MFLLFSSDIPNYILETFAFFLLNNGFIMISNANAFFKHFSEFLCHISPLNSWTNNCVWHLPRSQASQVLGRRGDWERTRCIAQWTMGTFSAGAKDAGRWARKMKRCIFLLAFPCAKPKSLLTLSITNQLRERSTWQSAARWPKWRLSFKHPDILNFSPS